MSIHVFLNLLNELGKRLAEHFISFATSLINSIQEHDSIYHMTNTLKSHFWRKHV